MILSDKEIWMEIGSQRLKFTPEIEPVQVTPSAVDLRLSNEFTTFNRSGIVGVETVIDLAKIENVEQVAEAYGQKETVQSDGSFLFEPGKLVLAFEPVP